MSEYLDRAFSPATLGSMPLKNRILKAATYEGKSPDGLPSEGLREFHREMVAGGVAMTTIGYCTVEADGRINDQMLWLSPEAREWFKESIRQFKEIDPAVKVSGQMTHCGNFSKNTKLTRLKRPKGPSRTFNMLGAPSGLPFAGAMTLEDIDYMVQLYADAAIYMKEVGFDGPILIDTGASDQFIDLLRPEALAQAIAERRQQATYRLQPGYDHSYFFVSTFMEDHITFHAEALYGD